MTGGLIVGAGVVGRVSDGGDVVEGSGGRGERRDEVNFGGVGLREEGGIYGGGIRYTRQGGKGELTCFRGKA